MYYLVYIECIAPCTLYECFGCRWMQSVSSSPGLNLPFLTELGELNKSTPEKYTNVCLMVDAMAIKQLMQFDHHKNRMYGYVDYGNNEDEKIVLFKICEVNYEYGEYF